MNIILIKYIFLKFDCIMPTKQMIINIFNKNRYYGYYDLKLRKFIFTDIPKVMEQEYL